MAKFVSREKLSKKVESKKLYNRRKSAHAWKDDFGMSAFCLR